MLYGANDKSKRLQTIGSISQETKTQLQSAANAEKQNGRFISTTADYGDDTSGFSTKGQRGKEFK